MRQVFSNNSELFHVFAQQNQDTGRANSASFNYNKCYSYSQCIGNIQGNNIFLINWNYSNTTAKHNNYLSAATNQYNQVFIAYPENPMSSDNVTNFVESFDNLLRKLQRAKKPSIYIAQIETLQENITKYIEATGINNEDLNNILDYSFENSTEINELIKERIKKEEQAKRLKLTKELKKFRNFEINWLHSDFDYLRINGENLETSQGVKVKLDVVKPLIELYKKFLNGCEDLKTKLIGKHIDYYTISEVNNKYVKIGCHKISKNEILSII